MTTLDREPDTDRLTPGDIVRQAIAQLDHILPAQAPIQDFVHHNTLHGYQHLPFEEALEEAEKLTGISAYVPEDKNRKFYQQGRITDDDLTAVFTQLPDLKHEETICTLADKIIRREDLYRIALLFDLKAISPSELTWQIEELAALSVVQPDVPEKRRAGWLADAHNGKPGLTPNPIRTLWDSLCQELELQWAAIHPENLLDLSLEQTEQWLDKSQTASFSHEQTQASAKSALEDLFSELGDTLTLRSLVHLLSGKDVLDDIRPQLIRLCASALDEGVAAWQLPDCNKLGLYKAWRSIARYDAYPFLHELPDWAEIMTGLPDDAVATIVLQLEHLALPHSKWRGYLRQLALELPGWAGMINWRQQHPGYFTEKKSVPDLADYLAIRLTMDRLWSNQTCRENWKCEATLTALHGYFSKNLSEFVVRSHLYQGKLPEYLTQQAELLVIKARSERQCRSQWRHLADLIHTWHFSPMADKSGTQSVNHQVWRLFRLCQHLELTGRQVRQIGKTGLLEFLAILDRFGLNERRKIWLAAYERHYREDLFRALRANHNRGRWSKREFRPNAQIIFCMDDREESFRRHLEELDPNIETLGAAGFFGVAMNYKGLDDVRGTPLCPIIVAPAHDVHEQIRKTQEPALCQRRKGQKIVKRLRNIFYHSLRTRLLAAQLVIMSFAPIIFLMLLIKSFAPQSQLRWLSWLISRLESIVKTQLEFTSTDESTLATPSQPKQGFTDHEQADRIAGFMRNTGLTYGFAPLVVLMGHGSMSQNNPHLAAYDCGACSGRHGGPNARLFAAMANRPEIRTKLAERGIPIPADTWFVGAEHNTCNEEITWFDTDDIPGSQQTAFNKLNDQLKHTQKLSAHERCRRLASAPRNPLLTEALTHIVERAADFSQARPELGHATNASAIVGRRSVSQGTFLDRRTFLISYDPTQDPDARIVEGILLNVGPVGAGINLEYYFSTANNDRLGCGTKVPHNVVGLFGVMEGAASDLRTGLPSQMVEIHEAMRLQLIVEAKTTALEQIYARQDSLRELIAGGWILLSAIDPDTGEIHVFERNTGFIPWQAEVKDLPVFACSTDCYDGKTAPVPPALIAQPVLTAA